jgi:NAD-dependent SIR2 family protein deacetylase
LADAVADALDEWRPAGAVVNVYPAITQMEDISVTCSFKAGTDTVAATTRIRDALVAYVNSMRVGEDLLKGALQALVASDRDVAVGTAVVVAPAADVVAASTEVLRTTAARVTVN